MRTESPDTFNKSDDVWVVIISLLPTFFPQMSFYLTFENSGKDTFSSLWNSHFSESIKSMRRWSGSKYLQFAAGYNFFKGPKRMKIICVSPELPRNERSQYFTCFVYSTFQKKMFWQFCKSAFCNITKSTDIHHWYPSQVSDHTSRCSFQPLGCPIFVPFWRSRFRRLKMYISILILVLA